MNEDIGFAVFETAVPDAWRTAWAVYATSPSYEAEDLAYAWGTTTSSAHNALSEPFPDPVVKHLARAMARAVRAHFCPEHEPEDE